MNGDGERKHRHFHMVRSMFKWPFYGPYRVILEGSIAVSPLLRTEVQAAAEKVVYAVKSGSEVAEHLLF